MKSPGPGMFQSEADRAWLGSCPLCKFQAWWSRVQDQGVPFSPPLKQCLKITVQRLNMKPSALMVALYSSLKSARICALLCFAFRGIFFPPRERLRLCIFIETQVLASFGIWANCFIPLNLDLGCRRNFFFPSLHSSSARQGPFVLASEVPIGFHWARSLPEQSLHCRGAVPFDPLSVVILFLSPKSGTGLGMCRDSC